MDVRIQSKPYHVRFQSSILPRVTYCKLNGEPTHMYIQTYVHIYICIWRAFRTLHAFNPIYCWFRCSCLTRRQIARTLFSSAETISRATRLNALSSPVFAAGAWNRNHAAEIITFLPRIIAHHLLMTVRCIIWKSIKYIIVYNIRC